MNFFKGNRFTFISIILTESVHTISDNKVTLLIKLLWKGMIYLNIKFLHDCRRQDYFTPRATSEGKIYFKFYNLDIKYLYELEQAYPF